MREEFEKVKKKIEEAWGPLALRDLPYACGLVASTIQEVVSNPNIVQSMYAVFLHDVEKKYADESQFIPVEDVLAIFDNHIELNTSLYVFRAIASHPDFADDDFCEHPAMHPRRALYDEFQDAVDEAYHHMDKVIGNLPPHMTNCEVTVELATGDILLPMGKWVWDKKVKRIFWAEPLDRN